MFFVVRSNDSFKFPLDLIKYIVSQLVSSWAIVSQFLGLNVPSASQGYLLGTMQNTRRTKGFMQSQYNAVRTPDETPHHFILSQYYISFQRNSERDVSHNTTTVLHSSGRTMNETFYNVILSQLQYYIRYLGLIKPLHTIIVTVLCYVQV